MNLTQRLACDEALKGAARHVALEDARRAVMHIELALAHARVWLHEVEQRERAREAGR